MLITGWLSRPMTIVARTDGDRLSASFSPKPIRSQPALANISLHLSSTYYHATSDVILDVCRLPRSEDERSGRSEVQVTRYHN